MHTDHSPPSQKQEDKTSYLRKTTLFLFLGGLLMVGLVYSQTELARVIILVREKAIWKAFVAANVFIFLQLVFRSMRFKFLLQRLYKEKIYIVRSFMVTSASFLVALATPSKSGDLTRGLFIKERKSEVFIISANEYVLDSLIVLLVPLTGLFVDFSSPMKRLLYGYSAILLAVLLSVIMVVKIDWSNRFSRLKLYLKYEDKIKKFKSDFFRFYQQKAIFFISIVFSLLISLPYYIAFHIVLKHLGADVSFILTLVAASCGILFGSITFMPMGIGTRDATAYGLLVLFGVEPEISITSVLVVRSLSITLLAISSVCYFYVLTETRRKSSCKKYEKV